MLLKGIVLAGSCSRTVSLLVSHRYCALHRVAHIHMLSDYRHQEDEGVASRGTISMKTAIMNVAPGSLGLRFDVHSPPPRHGSAQKWFLKANHPKEASRWIQALQKAIEFAKRDVEERKSIESDAPSSYAPSGKQHRPSTSFLHRSRGGSGATGPGSTTRTYGYDSASGRFHGSGRRRESRGFRSVCHSQDASFVNDRALRQHSQRAALHG